MRSRICACTVTSRAVVGSSANSSVGPQASAMAMMMRWRMPPDSSCGYCRSRFAGSGMPTSSSNRNDVSLRRRPVHVEVDLQRLGDLVADRMSGFSERHRVLEDHRHLPAPVAAHLLAARAGRCGAPRSCTSPSRMVLRLGSSPMIERDRIVLPEPDSPTTPSDRPRSQGEVDAVDGPHDAARCAEVGLQAAHLEQRPRQRPVDAWDASVTAPPPSDEATAHHSVASRMSNRRATWSPMRLKASTVTNSIRLGKMRRPPLRRRGG